jgi:hypothetical protein
MKQWQEALQSVAARQIGDLIDSVRRKLSSEKNHSACRGTAPEFPANAPLITLAGNAGLQCAKTLPRVQSAPVVFLRKGKFGACCVRRRSSLSTPRLLFDREPNDRVRIRSEFKAY